MRMKTVTTLAMIAGGLYLASKVAASAKATAASIPGVSGVGCAACDAEHGMGCMGCYGDDDVVGNILAGTPDADAAGLGFSLSHVVSSIVNAPVKAVQAVAQVAKKAEAVVQVAGKQLEHAATQPLKTAQKAVRSIGTQVDRAAVDIGTAIKKNPIAVVFPLWAPTAKLIQGIAAGVMSKKGGGAGGAPANTTGYADASGNQITQDQYNAIMACYAQNGTPGAAPGYACALPTAAATLPADAAAGGLQDAFGNVLTEAQYAVAQQCFAAGTTYDGATGACYSDPTQAPSYQRLLATQAGSAAPGAAPGGSYDPASGMYYDQASGQWYSPDQESGQLWQSPLADPGYNGADDVTADVSAFAQADPGADDYGDGSSDVTDDQMAAEFLPDQGQSDPYAGYAQDGGGDQAAWAVDGSAAYDDSGDIAFDDYNSDPYASSDLAPGSAIMVANNDGIADLASTDQSPVVPTQANVVPALAANYLPAGSDADSFVAVVPTMTRRRRGPNTTETVPEYGYGRPAPVYNYQASGGRPFGMAAQVIGNTVENLDADEYADLGYYDGTARGQTFQSTVGGPGGANNSWSKPSGAGSAGRFGPFTRSAPLLPASVPAAVAPVAKVDWMQNTRGQRATRSQAPVTGAAALRGPSRTLPTDAGATGSWAGGDDDFAGWGPDLRMAPIGLEESGSLGDLTLRDGSGIMHLARPLTSVRNVGGRRVAFGSTPLKVDAKGKVFVYEGAYLKHLGHVDDFAGPGLGFSLFGRSWGQVGDNVRSLFTAKSLKTAAPYAAIAAAAAATLATGGLAAPALIAVGAGTIPAVSGLLYNDTVNNRRRNDAIDQQRIQQAQADAIASGNVIQETDTLHPSQGHGDGEIPGGETPDEYPGDGPGFGANLVDFFDIQDIL